MKAPVTIACIKEIPDPEGPSTAFQINGDTKRVVPVGIPPVINPFDQNALEAALRLKDRLGGKVIAMNMADKPAMPVLKRALSVGVDEVVVLQDPGFKDLTSQSTAEVLCAGIKKIGPYDLILTGRQSADWDFGLVGLLVAEILEIPAINLAQAVELREEGIFVERLRRVGHEVVTAPVPALVTVSSEVGDLRLPTLKAIHDAKKKTVTVWGARDLGIDPGLLRTRSIRSLSSPPSRERACLRIQGATPGEKGVNLALQLRRDRLI
ncbi:MAG: electron transfer flavoprotein subunit beta/FixA family protein [Thermodesulfobacteriota bacterium]